MIRRFFCALACVALLAGGARAEDMEGLVRLHVVAADNSAAAQALKLELRDTCLDCAGVCLSGAADADEAYMRLQMHAGDFEAACAARARELGYEGEVRAETGVFGFPDRVYGNLRVPAGEYRALRITIGGGEGRNWWCVLYPSLCALNEVDAFCIDPRGVLAWLKERMGGGTA